VSVITQDDIFLHSFIILTYKKYKDLILLNFLYYHTFKHRGNNTRFILCTKFYEIDREN